MNRLLTCLAVSLVALLFIPSITSANCTQGFWKNHPYLWCAQSLQLGDVVYNQDELLSILWLEVEGNGLVSLAHQLIAAKLNVACGADPIDCIADADALVGMLVVPPVGTGHLPPEVTSPLIQCLTAFNESPGGNTLCDVIPIDPTNWGSIKAMYR